MSRLTREDNEAVQRCQPFFDDYTLLMRRGAGAQGAVFSAVHDRTDRKVAIKLLDSALVTERQRQRFLREIDLISQLRHPNIVTVYDFNLIDDHPYYTMDLVSGMNILDHVTVNALDVRRTVELFLEVCDAVAHAHRHGIIHRDLKPSNLLVDEKGCPFVVDFGLAKAVASVDDGASESCMIVGTIPYMSPEQSLGAEADALSDVYSLGVILFELLTEHLPFDMGGSREALLDRMRHRPPLSFGEALADDPARFRGVNKDLQAVVYKTLSKDPAERYLSVAALAEDLRRWLDGRAIEARAENGLYVLRKAAQRYRGVIAAGVVLLAALGLAFWQHLEALDVTQQAQASLNMGACVKMASAIRDSSRIQDAIALFQDAIDLGDTMGRGDDTQWEWKYKAHVRLAELLIEDERLDRAEAHCQVALNMAGGERQRRPADSNWARYQGFAYRVASKLELARKNIPEAEGFARQCLAVREHQALEHPQDHAMQRELATALGLLGRCCNKAGRPQEAWEMQRRSHGILKHLQQQSPENSDHAMELAYSYHRLAVLHMRRQTAEDYAEASRMFDAIDELAGDEAMSNRAWELDKLRDAVQQNRRVIRRRSDGDAS